MQIYTKEDSRAIIVDMEDGKEPYRLLPTSETSGAYAPEKSRLSLTYRWIDGDTAYRIQIQAQPKGGPAFNRVWIAPTE